MKKITVVFISHWVNFGELHEEAIEDVIEFDNITDFHSWLFHWEDRVVSEHWNYA